MKLDASAHWQGELISLASVGCSSSCYSSSLLLHTSFTLGPLISFNPGVGRVDHQVTGWGVSAFGTDTGRSWILHTGHSQATVNSLQYFPIMMLKKHNKKALIFNRHKAQFYQALERPLSCNSFHWYSNWKHSISGMNKLGLLLT